MRVLLTILAVLLVVSLGSEVLAQNGDPFGGDPFGGGAKADGGRRSADPFAFPANTPQANAARKAVIDRAKRAIAEGRKPVRVAPANDNEAERRIKAALDNLTTQTFVQTPLEEAVMTISETHQIPVVIDRRVLEEVGLTSDAPVTINLRNVTLRSFLRLMLRDLELTYLVKDGVMQITTVEAAEQNLVLEMYILPENLAAKSDQVIKVLTTMVVPDTWDTLGGPSSASAIDHVLVVSTTSDVQDQTQEFLAMLIEKYGK